MNDADGRRKERHLVRGMLAGAAGGLAASFVMNQFHEGLSSLTEKNRSSRRATPEPEEKPDDATEKTADAIARVLTGNRLKKEEKIFYGPIVHYAFGSAMGALYGAAAECSPAVCTGFGTFFGSALFVGADGIAVPALGLSPSVRAQPVKPLLFHWLSHMVYGTTVELVRSGMRRMV